MATSYALQKISDFSFEGYSDRFDITLSNNTKKRLGCRTRAAMVVFIQLSQENSFIETKAPNWIHCIPVPEGRCIDCS